MPSTKWRDRQPDETDEHWEARLKRRAELRYQVSEEVRFAAAGRNMPLAEVSRRMGDPTGRALASNKGQMSLDRLADVGLAMGVTFRLMAIPDSEIVAGINGGPKPRSDRRFSPHQVREIKRMVEMGMTQRRVALELRCNPSVISDIMRGASYKDVT